MTARTGIVGPCCHVLLVLQGKNMPRLGRHCALWVVIGVALIASEKALAQDVVEFLTGAKITGKIKEIREADKTLDIDVKFGSRTLTRTYAFSKMHAVTIGGERRVLTPRQNTSTRSTPSSPSGAIRSRAEINDLINKMGTTPPDWFDSVSLDYPNGIDLAWPQYSGPWDPGKNVGQYMWSVINENPGRWKAGTLFMHHVLNVNKNRPDVQQKAFGQLGHCYHDLLGDWARAAFWWRKLARQDMNSFLGLADCYWKLGSKDMAAEQLSRIRTDFSRYGSAIKLWSDMGELDKALALAEASARDGYPSGAYSGAGDACRKHERYAEAVAYYRKVLALPMRTNNKGKADPIFERNRQRAQTAIDTITTFEAMDVTRIPDGAYTGTSLAYVGDLTVVVSIQQGRITSVRVTDLRDKQYYSALKDTPAQIMSKQGLKGVDATTGATITSQAIIEATAKALASGMH